MFINFAGYNPCSLVDYPGKVAFVAFVCGCNLRCSYCHNFKQCVSIGDAKMLNYEEILDNYVHVIGNIDVFVISGGEPTIYADLPECIYEISKNYKVKLDTNGSHHGILEECMGYLDYIAMDIKASLSKYNLVKGDGYIRDVVKSLNIIKDGQVDHEFRITVVDPIIKEEDLEGIGDLVEGGQKLYLQKVRLEKVLCPEFPMKVVENETLKYYQDVLNDYIPTYLRL